MLKLNSTFSKPIKPFALQTPISKYKKLQVKIKSIASHLPHSYFSLVIASQFTLSLKLNKPNLKTPIALQTPSSISKHQFALNILPLQNQIQLTNFLQIFCKSQRAKSKKCEQSKQLSPKSHTNSTNHHKFSNLVLKHKNSIHK